MMIVNDDSSIIIKWSFKLIDATRGIIYDRHMFIVKATGKWTQPCLVYFHLFSLTMPLSYISSIVKGWSTIPLTMDSPRGSWWFTDNTFGGPAKFFVGNAPNTWMVDSSTQHMFQSIQKLIKLELHSDHFSGWLYQPGGSQ